MKRHDDWDGFGYSRVCAFCNKNIYIPDLNRWTYKITKTINKGCGYSQKVNYFCSYTCKRKYEEKSQKKRSYNTVK